jgi:hypothetical protein
LTELEPRPVVVGPRRPPPAVLARLLALAAALRRGTLKLAATGAVAAAVIGYALLRDGFPDDAGHAIVTVLGLAAAAAPPLILVAFWVVLGELLELPHRIRRLPFDAREHGEHLRRLAQDARAERGGWIAVPRHIWRLTRLTASSRELLTPYAPVLPLLSLPFLVAVVLAAAAVVVETLAVLVLLIDLAFA